MFLYVMKPAERVRVVIPVATVACIGEDHVLIPVSADPVPTGFGFCQFLVLPHRPHRGFVANLSFLFVLVFAMATIRA